MKNFESACDQIEESAAEFLERHRRGEQPSVEEYAARFPEHAAEIRKLFPTIAAVENLKTPQVRTGAALNMTAVNSLERLGDLRIVREIGRGGMGIVYEAEQESLRRQIAVPRSRNCCLTGITLGGHSFRSTTSAADFRDAS